MDLDPDELVKAKRFRARAVEVRAEAETMDSSEIRELLLKVAVIYEQLADSIEARAHGLQLSHPE